MKIAKVVSLLFLCALIGFADFSAEAQFKKLKNKVEKKIDKEKEEKKEKKKQKEDKAAEEKIYAENLGTGVRKTGGTYAALELASLQDSDDLQFKCVSGKCNSVTVHGRTSNGIWHTLYQGQLKDVNVGTIVSGKRSNYTHLNVSVNGAHESYDKTAAKLEITKSAGKGGATVKPDTAVKPDTNVKPDTAVKPEDKKDDSMPKYKIGDKGPAGGWIFYDKGSYSDGWRYLEAAPSDIDVPQSVSGDSPSGYMPWWSGRTNRTAETKTAAGSGKSNTARILAAVKSSGFNFSAAQKCAELKTGGYSDWYLPSKDELMLLYTNLMSKSRGNFSDAAYWSSSEVDSMEAWVFNLNEAKYGGGKEPYGGLKHFRTAKTRAIRSF